ncbi:MAG: DUF998 domain-containing protein [Nitrospirae bacterium]|nr:DUF998 domain-containing protein [Nitrospirota bacterium]
MASGELLNGRLTRLWGALFAIVGVVVFIVIVVTLHLLQPDYDPANQLMSELALGAHGWAMLPAFIFLSVSVFGLQAALGPFGASRALRFILVVASASFLASGVFPLGAASELHIAFIVAAFVLVVLGERGAGRFALARGDRAKACGDFFAALARDRGLDIGTAMSRLSTDGRGWNLQSQNKQFA